MEGDGVVNELPALFLIVKERAMGVIGGVHTKPPTH